MVFDGFCIYIFLKLWDLEILLVLKIFWQPCLKLSTKCNQSYIHVGTIMSAESRMNNSYSLVLMHGAGHYDSTSEWSLRREDETRHVCATCDERVFIQYSFTK